MSFCLLSSVGFITAVLLVASPYAVAQEGQPSAPTSSPTNASPLVPAKYSGRVTEIDGNRSSDLLIDLTRNPGSINMYRAAYPCARGMAIRVASVEGDKVRLESNKEGVILGCERTFDLVISGSELNGIMISPTGAKFRVNLTRQ